MNLKGTETEKNLLTAFAGESQARNRYTYAAEKAREEGYEQIAAIFEETAGQEKEHARRLFRFLEGGEAEIRAAFPAGVIAGTLDNLHARRRGRALRNHGNVPGFRASGGKRRIYRNRGRVQEDRRGRETPRGSVRRAGQEHLRRSGLQANRRPSAGFAAIADWFTKGRGPQGLSGVPEGPVLLRDRGRQLLTGSDGPDGIVRRSRRSRWHDLRFSPNCITPDST